jgi:hypothetical protein
VLELFTVRQQPPPGLHHMGGHLEIPPGRAKPPAHRADLTKKQKLSIFGTMLWVILVLPFGPHVGYDVSAAVGVITAIVTALITALAQRRDPGRPAHGVLTCLLAAQIVATGLWGAGRYYTDHVRAIPVAGQVRLTGNTDMIARTTAVAAIPDAYHRSHLSITFAVTNVIPSSQCADETYLETTLIADGSSFGQQQASSYRPLEVNLHGALANIKLAIKAVNRQHDVNCKVNVAVAAASVYNWPVIK